MLCCKASGQKRGTPVPVKTEDETSTKAPSSTTAGASSVRGDPKLRVKRELVKAEQEDDDAGEADASMRSSYKRRKEKEAKTAKQVIVCLRCKAKSDALVAIRLASSN